MPLLWQRLRGRNGRRGKKGNQWWLLTVYAFGLGSLLTCVVPFLLKASVEELLVEGVSSLPSEGLIKQSALGQIDENYQNQRTDDPIVHIVFSTDCSGYQHWQGIAMWYAAQSALHDGPITRIASGCDDESAKRIAAEWKKIDGGRNQFRVHFTPSMKIEGQYKYSNKPGGLRHWLEHAVIDEQFIVLLDPDMMVLLPITTRLTAGLDPNPKRRSSTNQVEYVDKYTGIARLLRVDDQDLLEPTEYVKRGSPAGQFFGLGGTWSFAGADRKRYPKWANFSKARVCGEGAPCTQTSVTDAKKRYSVGPVYLAHIDDWRRIADAWWKSMDGVYSQHPYLLAEMFALTMAVANLTLPWTLLSNYMVTGAEVTSPTEAWSWIDDIGSTNATAVCSGASQTELPFITRDRSTLALPTTLHYCQRYKYANHLFAKRKIKHDFFRCNGSQYLEFDVDAVMQELTKGKPSTNDIRSAFMICHVIPMMNAALDSYRSDVC